MEDSVVKRHILLIMALFGTFCCSWAVVLNSGEEVDLEIYDPNNASYFILDENGRPAVAEVAVEVGEVAREWLKNVALPVRNVFFGG